MSLQHWANSHSVELVARRGIDTRRQFLVFVIPTAGTPSPLLQVLQGHRNFDIAARFYDSPGPNEAFLDHAEFVMTGGLSKFHAAALFLQMCALEDAYEGYVFLDGDLEFDPEKLSDFLSLVHGIGLQIAQPSVTRDSYCYWKMAYHQPGYLFRETSFVEVMAPYISRAALKILLPTFMRSISTYGLDLVWPKLVGDVGIGVIDAYQIRHRDRVDHASGSFYRYLKSIGVDLDEEERQILAEHGVTPEQAHSRRGYFWRQKWGRHTADRRLVSVPLDGPERKTQKQFLIDLAMRKARWQSPRTEDVIGAAVAPFVYGNGIK